MMTEKTTANEREEFDDGRRTIVWKYCKDVLPEESGRYLVCKLSGLTDSVQETVTYYFNEAFRRIDTALFLSDLKMWDCNVNDYVYAWAELPKSMSIGPEKIRF